MNEADPLLTFIGRLLIEMDQAITAPFEADRLLLGGRIALFQSVEQTSGTVEHLRLLTAGPEEL